MGMMNDVMCSYLSRPDVFADYWNGVYFQGQKVLGAEELQPLDGTYYQTKSGQGRKKRTKSRRRDLIMKATKDATYAILAVENQQEIDYRMPVRQMEYDAMEYSRQMGEVAEKNRQEAKRRKRLGQPGLWRHAGEFLTGFRREDRLTPVVTVTFYHGQEDYDGCRDIHGMLKWNQENQKFAELVSNYQLNLVTLKDIEEERFQTGLRELIGIMKRSGDMEILQQYCEENEERFRDLDEETMEAIGVMINYPDLNKYRDEGGMQMCKALEDLKRAGFEEGISQGIEQGISQGISQGIEQGISQGIQGMIEGFCEIGVSRDVTLAKMKEKFSLSDTEAEGYLEKYWK